MNQITIRDTENRETFSLDPSMPLNIYICGPTVYTASHVGHLKTYMTFDIIRRIMRDYLGLNLSYMMNITNVDDKIIRSTYLEKYPHLSEKEYPNNITEDQYLPTSDFENYADRWEKDFFNVLERVNILPPDIVSRVTEYIDEILEFVEEIWKNGYAFDHDGSVYFYGTKYLMDTKTLTDEEDKDFEPNDEESMKNPESKHNFVLLKKARPHEPGWESRWGRIRPGWHIECSAMASAIFGNTVDIHGGGIDLAFPHHHNEVLQSNARFYPPSSDKAQAGKWVQHFMHTGHLNIKGLKMSRSLKNFITIDEALSNNTADELRMLFLLHHWDAPMDYSNDTMRDAEFYVEMFRNFEKQVRSIVLRKNGVLHKKYGPNELEFSKVLVNTKREIDEALRTNLNTPATISHLQELVKSTFEYVTAAECGEEDNIICTQLIHMSFSYVKEILEMFGLTIFDNNRDSKEDGLIQIVSDIRVDLRTIAQQSMTMAKAYKSNPDIGNEFKSVAGSLYRLTDEIRDQRLKEIGVELTDK